MIDPQSINTKLYLFYICRYETFKNRLSALFTYEREESLSVDKVHEWMGQGQEVFSRMEINAGLKRMEDDEKIMLAEGFIFLI